MSKRALLRTFDLACVVFFAGIPTTVVGSYRVLDVPALVAVGTVLLCVGAVGITSAGVALAVRHGDEWRP